MGFGFVGVQAGHLEGVDCAELRRQVAGELIACEGEVAQLAHVGPHLGRDALVEQVGAEREGAEGGERDQRLGHRALQVVRVEPHLRDRLVGDLVRLHVVLDGLARDAVPG